jgi:hypothetical protein
MKIPEIDLQTLTCSLLIVEPKPPFFEWLENVLKYKPIPSTVEKVYFQKEDPVWIIPYIPYWNSGDMTQYLEDMKPKLLKFHLSAFVRDVAQLPDKLDAATFDRFFQIKLRIQVYDIRNLNQEDWKWAKPI